MLASWTFPRCFEIPLIAERMLQNDERLRTGQVADLRAEFPLESLPALVREFLDGDAKAKCQPRRGRLPVRLNGQTLTTRLGVMIYYPIFLAEERARSKMKPKPDGSPSTRALLRIKDMYTTLPALEALRNAMSGWRKDRTFMSIVNRVRMRMKDHCLIDG